MRYAVVVRPGLYGGKQCQPGDVIDTTGMNVGHLADRLSVLPSDPEVLERLAQSIRDLQEEEELRKVEEEEQQNQERKRQEEEKEKQYQVERIALLEEADKYDIKPGPNWKNETIATKIAEKKESSGSSEGG